MKSSCTSGLLRGALVACGALLALPATSATPATTTPERPVPGRAVPAAADPLAHAGHGIDPDVEVVAHRGNGLFTTDAASQGVVSAKQLQALPLARQAEVLERVPGMVATQHSGDGKANQYFLRGFNLDHGTDFATRVAGVPVNLPTHAHGHGYTDLGFLIPELIDRIAYSKGPYYARSGDFSAAGSADIAFVRRLQAPVVSLSAGSFGYRRLLAMASADAGPGSVLGAVEASSADGPWTVPQNLERRNAVLRFASAPGARTFEATLMAYSARWTATDQIPRRALDDGTLGRFDSLDPTTGGRTDRFSASAAWRNALRDGEFEASFWLLRYGLDLYSNFTYFLDRPSTGDQFRQRDRRSAAGGSMSRLWTGSAGGRDWSSAIGVQMRADRIDVGLADTIARRVESTIRDDRVRQRTASLFWEGTFSPTPWFRTIGGLRYDSFRFDVDALQRGSSGRDSADILAPKLSLVFGPWARSEVFINAGRGFHSNDARGVLTRVDPRTGAATEPVRAIAPANGQEIGVRSEWLPGALTSLALWRLALASELVFVGDAGTTEARGASVRSGIELSHRHRLRDWLFAEVDLAWTRSRFRDDDPTGRSIPGAPRRVAALSLSVRDAGPWSASVGLRYLGARPLIEDGSVRSESMLMWNARLSRRVHRPDVTVFVDVFNLTNRRANDIEYFYASQLRGEASGTADRHLHPIEPRSVRVGLTVGL